MPPSPPRCVATPQHAAAPTRSPPPRRRCRMRARDFVGRSGCPAAPRTRMAADSERLAPSSGSSRDCWRSRWARRRCPPATSPPTRTSPPSASNTTTRYFLEFLMCDRVTLAACWSWEKVRCRGVYSGVPLAFQSSQSANTVQCFQVFFCCCLVELAGRSINGFDSICTSQ